MQIVKSMLVGLLLAAQAANDTPSGTLRLEVIDVMGAAVGGAYVYVHADSALRNPNYALLPDASTWTDRNGRLSVELLPNFYDVCVMFTSFTPLCKKVRIHDGRATEHRFTMSPDPEILRELKLPI